MAQTIGGIVLAYIAYMLTNNVNMFFGACIFGAIVWLSTESFFGGLIIAGICALLLANGYIALFYLALLASVWTFVAWGLND